MSPLASLAPDGADSTQVLTPALSPLSVREVLPWLLFAGLLLVVAWYLVSTEQGASAFFAGNAVHEWVHDGRHLLGFPCH